jgi:hypothetical protein
MRFTHEMHAYEVHAHEMHAWEMHTREVYTREMHTYEMDAYKVYYKVLLRRARFRSEERIMAPKSTLCGNCCVGSSEEGEEKE